MREVVLSATVLLCAVFLIRGVLKDRIPAGARYALWALVAVRLLVPVNLGASAVSVANLGARAAAGGAGVFLEREARLVGEGSPHPALRTTFPQGEGIGSDVEGAPQTVMGGGVSQGDPSQSGVAGQLPPEGGALGSSTKGGALGSSTKGEAFGSSPEEGVLGSDVRGDAGIGPVGDGGRAAGDSGPYGDGIAGLHLPEGSVLLRMVWVAGVVGMAAWFVVSNLRLWGRLRRSRREYPVEGCPVPVYRADFLASPCLAGVFRPAIYLNREAAEHPERLKYILAHELAHRRHGDNSWAVVRAACLCLWWFHPLVWIAAVCSKRDCELSCDASAVRALGEEERVPYGRTLVEMVAAGRPRAGELLSASTAMTEGPRQIKERVIQVSAYRKIRKKAVAAAVCLAMLAGLCTFTGAVERGVETETPLHVEAVPGVTALDLEATDEVSIPDFEWAGNEASYSREVAARFLAEYGKRLYGLPDGAPWKAADVAVLGTGYEWTGVPDRQGDWGQEPHKNGKTHEVWETGALAVKPVGRLEAVAALYNGGLPRGTGEFEGYALMELACSLTLEDGRWYARGNKAYSLALRANVTPPPDERDWTDEQVKMWSLDARVSAEVAGDDRAAWEEAGRLWAEAYVRQHLTASDNGSPAKADDVRLTTMELVGWTPSETPEALMFHLEYTFRPVWGKRAGARLVNEMDDNYVGAYWLEDSDYVTVTAAVTLRRGGTDNGKIVWSGYQYQGQYAQNYANGMDLSLPFAVPEAAGAGVRDVEPVGVSVTFPAGTDETRQRYAVFGLWAAEFGQQFYRLPKDHPLYCDSVEVNYGPSFAPSRVTSSGAALTVMGATEDVGLMLRPVNGQKGAADALGSDWTYVYAPGTNGRTYYDGKIDTRWHVTLERSYNDDGSVTWTCVQGRAGQDSDREEPAAVEAIALPYHVEPKAGLSLSTLDGDIICVPDDGKGDLATRWAIQFGQQFYALPEGAAWKASDVVVYDAGDNVGLAVKPAGGLAALEGQFPEGYPCPVGKGELEGYALLQYNVSFRRQTVDIFGTEPVWVKDRGGIQWIPGPPEVGSEDWQDAMEHSWKKFLNGNYSYLNVYANEPGDPDEACRVWAERYLDGLRGDGMWDGGSRKNGGSPLQADDVRLLELTRRAVGEVDGEESVTFTLRYALRPVWGMEVAKACAPDLAEGSGELAGYAVRSASVELRFRAGETDEDDGYGYQREPEGGWYCAGVRYRMHPMG